MPLGKDESVITDVPGIKVGQAEDPKVRTGVTVILADDRYTCAVDVRGGGPGTRETDVLDSWNLVHSADAVVLSGVAFGPWLVDVPIVAVMSTTPVGGAVKLMPIGSVDPAPRLVGIPVKVMAPEAGS